MLELLSKFENCDLLLKGVLCVYILLGCRYVGLVLTRLILGFCDWIVYVFKCFIYSDIVLI